ncbi:hypothetical protein ACLOJK_029920 [Asimina triloba]
MRRTLPTIVVAAGVCCSPHRPLATGDEGDGHGRCLLYLSWPETKMKERGGHRRVAVIASPPAALPPAAVDAAGGGSRTLPLLDKEIPPPSTAVEETGYSVAAFGMAALLSIFWMAPIIRLEPRRRWVRVAATLGEIDFRTDRPSEASLENSSLPAWGRWWSTKIGAPAVH